VQWLIISLVLSVVLTIVLNVGLSLFPGSRRRATGWLDDIGSAPTTSRTRMRVIVPWKAMIAVSVVLTVAINVLLWLK
jgi:hypothetical protein